MELTGKDGNALEVNHTAKLDEIYSGMKDAFKVDYEEIKDD